MLIDTPAEGQAPPSVLPKLRELLAKNIAARNPGIGALVFPGLVSRILFALSAARLLERAGYARGSPLDDILREKGLFQGLSSFFEETGTLCRNKIAGLPGSTGDAGFFHSFPDLCIDEQVTEKVISLTGGPGFFPLEWTDFRSDTGTLRLTSFLRQRIRISQDNRVVVEETPANGHYSARSPLPWTYILQISENVLEKRLFGKTPVSGGRQRTLDPCCDTGRFLGATFAYFLDWHMSWYQEHLIPLLCEGKDPASRRVQQMIPEALPGTATPGSNPLPVYRTPDGDYTLTWGEKARVLSGSVFGMDSDPQAVMVTRLLLLSLLLHDLKYPDVNTFRPDLIMSVIVGNIREGNALVPGDWEGIARRPGVMATTGNGDVTTIEKAFPESIGEGGFDIIIGAPPHSLVGTGNEFRDFLSGHYHVRKTTDDAEPFFIERGLSLLKKGSVYCGTGTGKWQRAPYASRFRAWLASFQLTEVIEFRDLPGSGQGETGPFLTCVTNIPGVHPFQAVIAGNIQDPGARGYTPRFCRQVDPHTLTGKPWVFFEFSPAKLRNLIRERGTPLGQAFLGEYFRGGRKVPAWRVISREEGTRALKKDPIIRSFLLPLARKEEVSPYAPVQTEHYIMVIPEGTTKVLAGINHDPATWFPRHHRTVFNLVNRNSGEEGDQYRTPGSCWWEWKGSLPPHFLHGEVFLFSTGTGATGSGWAMARSGAYPGPGVVALPGRDLSTLGILNSNLFRFYTLSSGNKRERTNYTTTQLLSFPLYIPDPENKADMNRYSAIAGLVKRRCILASALVRKTAGEGTTMLLDEAANCDHAIDHLVYELYGMSETDSSEIEYWLSENRR